MSLSEVCAFYSKENIFYILLTVDFFVVNIFCIFIYKSHKKNSDVQLYTLNLQLEENKVNSVVSGSKCPFKNCASFFFCLGWEHSWDFCLEMKRKLCVNVKSQFLLHSYDLACLCMDVDMGTHIDTYYDAQFSLSTI